jgi:hypothetical protein
LYESGHDPLSQRSGFTLVALARASITGPDTEPADGRVGVRLADHSRDARSIDLNGKGRFAMGEQASSSHRRIGDPIGCDTQRSLPCGLVDPIICGATLEPITSAAYTDRPRREIIHASNEVDRPAERCVDGDLRWSGQPAPGSAHRGNQ